MKNSKYLLKNIFSMFSKYLKQERENSNSEVKVDRNFIKFHKKYIIIDDTLFTMNLSTLKLIIKITFTEMEKL